MQRRVVAVLVAVASVLGVLVGITAASAWAEGGCPNEALRVEQGSSGLPDCRAYEMVSPAYQEGYPLLVAGPGSGFAADGNKALVAGLGNLAGASGAGEAALEPNFYVETRGAGGWQIAPLNSPLSELVGQLPVAFEADTGASLWSQHTPGESAKTRDLYVRSSASVYSDVGPLDPNYAGGGEPSDVIEAQQNAYDHPAAGTSDYEHIVLTAHESPDYWSFDTTEGLNSLYEYSGTGNAHPLLVGVTGVKESTKLVGECGVVLGSGEVGSEVNALSGDGETVFFTVEPQGRYGCASPAPLTAEVYARRHGGRVSPLPAETVDVSESECTVACGRESGKNFEGASRDGQRVFFTSTQKLTNDAVDGTVSGSAVSESGGCAISIGSGGCNLYGYEFLPEQKHVLKLVAGGDEVLGVAGIAQDGARVYFVARAAIAGSGENVYHLGPVGGQPNLYVYDMQSGSTTFIATLGERGSSDEYDWTRDFLSRTSEVSGGDGQFLLFASSKEGPGVTPDAEGGAVQLFEYDAETGELVRVTKGESDYNHDGNGVTRGVEPESVSDVAHHERGFITSGNELNIADDGRTVVFETAGELSPSAVAARAGCTSVYEFRSTGPISQGSVHLISDGRDVQANKGSQCGAAFESMDADGDNILFSTADPLVSGDVDGVLRSLYDARVDGGFPPVVSAASCGEGCEGSVSVSPPMFAAPGSAGLTGTGNPAQQPPLPTKVVTKKAVKPVKCAKGMTRRHGRCVKAKRKVKAKAKGTSVALRMRGAHFHG
jgi:hypothetical protein